MLAVTACQLLGEAFEGYEAWEAGDRHLALEHIESVGINLALLGGFAAAGHTLPRLFGKLPGRMLQEVRGTDGTFRLWNQDLAPYRSNEVLPTQVQPNALGQYLHEGRCFIKMDGHLYEQRLDPALSRWQIVHPERPDACSHPLSTTAKALGAPSTSSQVSAAGNTGKAPGEPFEAFTAEQIQQACDVTGIDNRRCQSHRTLAGFCSAVKASNGSPRRFTSVGQRPLTWLLVLGRAKRLGRCAQGGCQASAARVDDLPAWTVQGPPLLIEVSVHFDEASPLMQVLAQRVGLHLSWQHFMER
ncbi:hypothetical protein GTA07_16180 [Rhodococcus hoagii]|nr:hypothetical protein [Prescottella equi]